MEQIESLFGPGISRIIVAIAGMVGFALTLLQFYALYVNVVRRNRLEELKLQLEVKKLKNDLGIEEELPEEVAAEPPKPVEEEPRPLWLRMALFVVMLIGAAILLFGSFGIGLTLFETNSKESLDVFGIGAGMLLSALGYYLMRFGLTKRKTLYIASSVLFVFGLLFGLTAL